MGRADDVLLLALAQGDREPRAALAQLKDSSKISFTLLPDDLGADRLPPYAKAPNKITDGHLLELARHHGARLATLDTGIPGALLIPGF